jgi:RyR domain
MDDHATEQPGGRGPAVVFVCLPDNDDALSAGLAAAAQSLATRSGRVVICLHDPSPFGALLTGQRIVLDDEQGQLAVFGVLEEGCVPERVRQDLHDQLARAIHQAYLDHCAAQGDSPERNPSMRPWTELPDDLKQANLAQAADIRRKLRAIDCAIVPESAAVPVFAFTAGEVEQLAEQEHERWMRERQALGYVLGPDRAAKQHPDLLPWAGLSEASRDKDRNAVCEIPSILQQAGFQIIRLPPPLAGA